MHHPDFVSGLWTGFYNYQAGGERHPSDMTLTFVRGVLAGQGQDQAGVFGVAGCYDPDAGELSWTKTYYGGQSVWYKGFADAGGIWGTWELADGSKGGFHMWPSIENVMQAVRIARAKSATPPRRLGR